MELNALGTGHIHNRNRHRALDCLGLQNFARSTNPLQGYHHQDPLH
ncbi:unnamed protein product [Acanthoscelides obtectus]|uniref:Uncharacterized protein n=1 Tax=Acanthoscelides obtectus TaxID=200917 RepID=A0A9P0L8F9_ACAOB|nr:unnamed protein product [Acanthoscelides obtectus]CAK1648836.1 hypothetical protein AOBTE_LOCUS15915 [Acanthoscelides obtectus]